MLVEGYTSLNPEGCFQRGGGGVESHPHTLTIVQAQWLNRAVDSPFQTQTLCWFAFGLFSSTDNPTKWLSVEKEEPVRLFIKYGGEAVTVLQENKKREKAEGHESYKMGINSIRRIARSYVGEVEVTESADRFSIKIILSNF